MSKLSLEDHVEIQQLYARYAHTIDSGQSKAWAETFTADGTIETAIGNFTGHEALATFASDLFRQLKFRHWINNLLVEADGDGAVGRCYLLSWTLEDGNPPVASLHSHYEDRLAKSPEGWRFAVRKVIPDEGAVPTDLLPGVAQ